MSTNFTPKKRLLRYYLTKLLVEFYKQLKKYFLERVNKFYLFV